jgi:imidazolonepropionase-like amidohydrolase
MVTRRHLLGITAAAVMAQRTADAQSEPQVLFSNVRVFDGISPELSAPRHVMVRGNLISELSETPLSAGAGTTVIDGGGRTLMPGLIDAHVHMAMSTLPIALMMTADPNYSTLRTGRAAEEMLQRGFTSVRDLGGPTFGLKRAIDEGFIAGPRIWPCGATISQTSGHGDFRLVSDLPRSDAAPLHATERYGYAAIADGVPEVLRRVREQLMQGASQIKIMAGGGISSNFDPLDVTQYTEDEMRAAVAAATDWGTYVTVHAYTPGPFRRPSARASAASTTASCLTRRRYASWPTRACGGACSPSLTTATRVFPKVLPIESSSWICTAGRTRPMRWRRSMASRWPGAPTSSSTRRPLPGRVSTSPA